MTLFKICGLRDVENALIARECGASFIGFVFVPGVRRQIGVEHATKLIDEYRSRSGAGGPSLVGLFANQTLHNVNSVVKRCDLDFVQLCGDESVECFNGIDCQIIRQIKIPTDGDRKDIADYTKNEINNLLAHDTIPLLDRLEKGHLGGTGKSFDWTITETLPDHWKYMVAGGLNQDNVGSVIKQVDPWAVDVSSGVEIDGWKDSGKIEAFAQAVNAN